MILLEITALEAAEVADVCIALIVASRE